MKELFGDNPSEMLTLLVDGELSSSQETILYSQLASNDELRNEFRELLAIREAIQTDTEAFSPPLNSVSNIISSIGFNNANYINNAAVSSKFSSLQLFKKLWVPALIAILASLFTAFIIISIYDQKYSDFNQGTPFISSYEVDNSNIATHPPLIKDITTSHNIIGNSNNKSFQKYSNLRTNNDLDNNQQVIENQNKSENSTINILNNNHRNTNIQSLANSYFSISNIYQTSNTFIPIISNELHNGFPIAINELPQKSDGIGYSLHIRGISSVSFPNIEQPSQSKPFLNNVIFGAYLSAGEHHKLGFEFGQEPFGQRFTNIEDNLPKEYEQNPILFWAGLSYRYEYDKIDVLGGMQPFAQATFGSTELGPLGRAIIGLQYFNQSGIGFSLGLEGTLLLYENQKNIYSTKKLGLTYGMFFNF